MLYEIKLYYELLFEIVVAVEGKKLGGSFVINMLSKNKFISIIRTKIVSVSLFFWFIQIAAVSLPLGIYCAKFDYNGNG